MMTRSIIEWQNLLTAKHVKNSENMAHLILRDMIKLFGHQAHYDAYYEELANALDAFVLDQTHEHRVEEPSFMEKEL